MAKTINKMLDEENDIPYYTRHSKKETAPVYKHTEGNVEIGVPVPVLYDFIEKNMNTVGYLEILQMEPKYLLKCVNSFPALVEALRTAIKAMEDMVNDFPFYNDDLAEIKLSLKNAVQ